MNGYTKFAFLSFIYFWLLTIGVFVLQALVSWWSTLPAEVSDLLWLVIIVGAVAMLFALLTMFLKGECE